MDECPSCGGHMEERRRRTINVVFSGDEGADELETDDEDADVISWVCEGCGYKEEAQYRGDEDDED